MNIIDSLRRRGVRIPSADGVDIGPEVAIDRIAGDGVVLFPGCRIYGERTLILPGAKLGAEGFVTVQNCQVGPNVELKGGFFKDAVFLAGSCCGAGAHVREATVLEEYASIAHTVGLKQTILFPFVTLGSLINFCDCLMAGGTGRHNHSEVGSSYIHFNFTPNQDKATASLIGDVPRGVMLNQRPIFLGGQGGMVGPLRLDYGTTAAAGTILRKDELRPNRLIFGGVGRGGNIEARPGKYSGANRIVRNNLVYVANLLALRQWYQEIRVLFIDERFPEALWQGLVRSADAAIRERTLRLEQLVDKMAAAGAPSLTAVWPMVAGELDAQRANRGDRRMGDAFKEKILAAIAGDGKDYIAVVKALDPAAADAGTAWLQGIVDQVLAATMEKFTKI